MKIRNVLSLFDGCSMARLALDRAGIKYQNYYASEIDKYAIKIAKKNYPGTIHLGDITEWSDWQLKDIDLIVGGSPCQGFSFAGKQLNFDDRRSRLFFTLADIVKHYNPKYFLLENVRMKKTHENVITETLGVKPIMINSALVSAQNRTRLYWCNWKTSQPKDKGIVLADIIENGVSDRKKAYCLCANYHKGTTLDEYFTRNRRQLIFLKGRGDNKGGFRALDGKVGTLTSSRWEQNNFLATVDGYRKLTPVECERLQTLPDNFTEGVSKTQRYKMCGNGFTVDVIAHLFKCMAKKISFEYQEVMF